MARESQSEGRGLCHRAAATGRQLGSPALPRSRAGRATGLLLELTGPARPRHSLSAISASVTRSLPSQPQLRCTCSHTLRTGNGLTDYPDRIKPLLMKKQAPHRPSDMQRRQGTALLPPKVNSHIHPMAWVSTPRKPSPGNCQATALVPSHGRRTETHPGH